MAAIATFLGIAAILEADKRFPFHSLPGEFKLLEQQMRVF
jgi:hypothetical protein